MDLLAQLTADMKTAMKAGEKNRLTVIRMLLNEVKNIDLASKPITAEEAVAAYAKKLKKSQEEYQRLGKQAEADQFKDEIGIVEQYLPKKASSEDAEKLVDQFLAGNSFTARQFGQAMGAFMKAHGGQVDAGTVNALLKKKLQ
jgi:uncharacterized protein